MIFEPSNNQNVVFYIHGRGKNFEEEFEASKLPKVEEYSNTRFIIISWLSWGGSSLRPYQHAVNSASGLSDFLFAFNDYKSRKPGNVGEKKVTLLAHSMGNIPVKVFLDTRYKDQGLQKGLFDSIILSSADVPRFDHQKWVEKIDFSNKVYIIQNRSDWVLRLSELVSATDPHLRSPKLGLGFKTWSDVYIEGLASNAQYLDLTNLSSSSHQHFYIPPYFSEDKKTQLFITLLNGQSLGFPDPTAGLFRKSALNPIFYFYDKRPRINPLADQVASVSNTSLHQQAASDTWARLSIFSGTYISEITSSSSKTLPKWYRNLKITLKQNGNIITGTDRSGKIEIRGIREGDTIKFHMLPNEIIGWNEAIGIWKISADGSSAEGTWKVKSGRQTIGDWNLTKSE